MACLRSVLRILLVVLLAGVVAFTGRPSEAAFPGKNGRIAFQSGRDGNYEIYTMNPDGSGLERITSSPLQDSNPAWSPDGTKIAFGRYGPAGPPVDGQGAIYVANADGSEPRLVTPYGEAPSWSPDGRKIAFYTGEIHGTGLDVYVVNADGTGLKRLTSHAANDYDPAWSPKGQRIAFTSIRDGDHEIYVMGPDGSGVTQLTGNAASEGNPEWSPDGSKLAFHSDRDGDYEIYVMNADGSGVTQLTHNEAFDGLPAWSPDGTKIAFESDRAVWPGPPGPSNDVYVMEADGTGVRRLTTDPVGERRHPDWQPIPNEAPAVAFTASPESGEPPLLVSFDASASHDPDGAIVGYTWDFGDGAAGVGVTADHTYASSGLYTVGLTVTDDAGDASTAWLTIIVGIVGTSGDDTLAGTPGDDVVVGLGGDDLIRGLGGNDLILGGEGSDRLLGGSGDDELRGEKGDDHLDGGSGSDELRGGRGNDSLYGGKGRDRLLGDQGVDSADGGPGKDICRSERRVRCP